MLFNYIWPLSNPGRREHLQKANEAQAAAYYQSYRLLRRALTGLVTGTAGKVKAYWQARETDLRLSDLNDRLLRDIGLHREEIAWTARRVASLAPDQRVTLRELQRLEAQAEAKAETQVSSGPQQARPVKVQPTAPKVLPLVQVSSRSPQSQSSPGGKPRHRFHRPARSRRYGRQAPASRPALGQTGAQAFTRPKVPCPT